MSRYKPYSAYKDSGVEWIGMVPEHWEVMPVKFRFDARLGKMIQPASSSDSDMLIPYHRAQTVQWESIDDAAVEEMWASPSDIQKFSVKTGDLLICEGGDVCRSAIVKSSPWDDLIYQNSIHRVRAKDQYSVDWILRLMQHLRSSGWIYVLCNKNTIVHFTSEKLGALPCAFPSPKEASNIVDNLNRETTRIDTLIAKKTRFIELLKEKRQALITHAVTKGLDPNVKMKDSGVEWIGEVPEHWEVNRLKFTVASSKNGVWGEDPTGDDIEDLPCVRVADFNRDQLTVDLKEPTMRKIAVNERRGRILKYGDLLLEKSGGGEKQPVGCVVQYEGQAPAVCSNFIARIEVAKECDPTFVKYVHFALYCTRISTNSINQTSGIQNLDQDRYFNEAIALPPYTEQSNIAATIDGRTSRIDTLMVKSKLSIYLLKERRSALITAAVTGQIDLR